MFNVKIFTLKRFNINLFTLKSPIYFFLWSIFNILSGKKILNQYILIACRTLLVLNIRT